MVRRFPANGKYSFEEECCTSEIVSLFETGFLKQVCECFIQLFQRARRFRCQFSERPKDFPVKFLGASLHEVDFVLISIAESEDFLEHTSPIRQIIWITMEPQLM